jgi:hypothetical protein
MSDVIDDANDRAERWLTAQIEEHQYQMSATAAFNAGLCRNCDEKLDDGRAYCDSECASDFEKRQRANQRNGFRVVP